jgi:hypothetical protein
MSELAAVRGRAAAAIDEERSFDARDLVRASGRAAGSSGVGDE